MRIKKFWDNFDCINWRNMEKILNYEKKISWNHMPTPWANSEVWLKREAISKDLPKYLKKCWQI